MPDLTYPQCAELKEKGYPQELHMGQRFYARDDKLLMHCGKEFIKMDCFVKCPTSVDEFVAWLFSRGISGINLHITPSGQTDADGILKGRPDRLHVWRYSSIIPALFDLWTKAGKP
jgi:hypothetical protein